MERVIRPEVRNWRRTGFMLLGGGALVLAAVWIFGVPGELHQADSEAARAESRTYPSSSSPAPAAKLGRVEYATFHLKPGESTEWCHVPHGAAGLSWDWQGKEPLTDRVHELGDSIENPQRDVPAGTNEREATLVQHVRFTNPHDSPVTGVIYALIPGGKDLGRRVTLDNAPR